jgi:hypothetical protein
MTPDQYRILRMEFENIDIPDMDHFAGGCKKSEKLKHDKICAGFNNAGKVGKYHRTCRFYDVCSGEHFQYNP